MFPMETTPPPLTQYEAAWSLYRDWALATNRNPYLSSPADLEPFLRQNPCGPSIAKLRARAVSVRMGWVDEPSGEATHLAWPGANELLLSLPEALERIDPSGWPGGFRGRRDAFLLVLLGHVGLTRRQALDTRADGFEWTPEGWQLQGDLIASNPSGSPATCLSCAVSRWFGVLGENDHWSSSSARTFIARSSQLLTHDCQSPLLHRPDSYWREAHVLLPAIDRHGMTSMPVHSPMSERAVTSVLSTRRARLTAPPAPAPLNEPLGTTEQPDERGQRFVEYSWDEMDQIIDDTCDRADEVNARMTALLNDTASLLSSKKPVL